MNSKLLKPLSFLLACVLAGNILPPAASASAAATVNSVESLITAIENANDMDTITISGTVEITEAITIGALDKKVVLCGENGTTAVLSIAETIAAEAEVTFQNLTFAGGAAPACGIIVQQLGRCTVHINGVAFLYCTEATSQGTFYLKAGSAYFTNCLFEGGRGEDGGFIQTDEGSELYIDGCTFSAGVATGNGGAICAHGSVTIESSRFLNNHADTNGGAIYSTGALHINNSEFSGGDAQSGGMVYHQGSNATFAACVFRNGYAAQNGGQIYAEQLQMDSCQMYNGTADFGGGSIYVTNNSAFTNCTITANHAGQCGGGIWSRQDTTIQGSKVFNNSASSSGADIFSVCGLSILDEQDDYLALFESELVAGGWNAADWYSDKEFERYSADNITARLDIPCESLQSPGYITFAMYYEEPDNVDPDPNPPQPSEPDDDDDSDHAASGGKETGSASQSSKQNKLLVCGDAILSVDAMKTFCSTVSKFIPSEKIVTREEMAGFLRGLLSDGSNIKPSPQKDVFGDIKGSPYLESINWLAAEGVFAGSGEDRFDPAVSLSWAQLVTIFTRFVEPQKIELAQSNFAGHWAEGHIQTAVASGWLADAPLNLSAPVTIGDLSSFVSAILNASSGK